MNKKSQKYIILIYMLLLIVLITAFTDFGRGIAITIFSEKHYIKIDKIDKVVLYYTDDDFSEKFKPSSIVYEIEVTDKEFIKLIENTYKNKIINNYWKGGILYKGKFKLLINDNIELYTCDDEGFCLKYNDKLLKVKFNQEIFDKMIETMRNNYNITY